MSSPRRSRQRRAANQQQTRRAQVLAGRPELVAALADSFTCPDCHSERGRPRRDRHGFIHVAIAHDPGCPYLHGLTS